MTDLDRARMLASLVAGALIGPDYLDSAIALNHAAAAMDVEALHGRFVVGPDETEEASLTLLRTTAGALIGVIELDTSDAARLLRPD